MRRCALLAVLALGCSRERDPRPNVLLISLDSVRQDMLGAYGGRFAGRSPSPDLDRLAAEGVRVEDARSGTSWTLPAHVTLFTGVPELVHGVEQDGVAIDPALETLPEELRAAGYRTWGVYSGPYLDPRFGFGRGFERYVQGYGPELAAAAARAGETQRDVHALDDSRARDERYEVLERNADAERALEIASHRDSSSETVTGLVLAELARAADDRRPFFLFAHYFDPHYDYAPPPPFDRELDPDYAGAIDGRYFARRLADPRATSRDVEHLRALHAGELAWTDSQIGRVLAELDRLGLAANTLVVVVADHGDEFLEHRRFGHRRTLYEEVVRVPLILRWPGVLPAGKVESGIGLADVAPLVRELLATRSWLHAPVPAIGRLVLSTTGKREDVRVLESFRAGDVKLLRERALAPASPETLRWIDLAVHPGEQDEHWSTDFKDARARAALERFRAEYARQTRERRRAPVAEKADDLLAAFRGLGYAGEEARVGALPADELVLPPPGEHVLGAGPGR